MFAEVSSSLRCVGEQIVADCKGCDANAKCNQHTADWPGTAPDASLEEDAVVKIASSSRAPSAQKLEQDEVAEKQLKEEYADESKDLQHEQKDEQEEGSFQKVNCI